MLAYICKNNLVHQLFQHVIYYDMQGNDKTFNPYFLGQAPPNTEAILTLTSDCKSLLCLGTTLTLIPLQGTIYWSATFYHEAARQDTWSLSIYVTQLDSPCDVFFLGSTFLCNADPFIPQGSKTRLVYFLSFVYSLARGRHSGASRWLV